MPADFQSVVVLILLSAWDMVKRLWPYVVGGTLLGALVGAYLPHKRSFSLLTKRRNLLLLPVASLIGMVSPACTLGTVPVFAESIKRGASVGPAVSFLVASSLVNPQMSVLAAGALGVRFMVLQVIVAMFTALITGIAAEAAVSRGVPIQNSELLADGKKQDDPDHSPKHHSSHHMHKKHQVGLRGFVIRFVDLFEFVAFYFLIGTILASILSYVVDASAVISLLGQGKWYAVPLGALLSVPTYICGGGIIPFLAQAKLEGMHTGAILAFLIAGPATRITSLAALALLVKKRYVAVYAVFVVALATVVGWIFSKSL